MSTQILGDTGCRWENRKHQPFETKGYTWGGGEFSTFEECQRVIRVTIMALAPHFKDFSGLISFNDPNSEKVKECYLERTQFPFLSSPEGFDFLVYEAFHGRSSPQAFMKFRDHIDSNFSSYCE